MVSTSMAGCQYSKQETPPVGVSAALCGWGGGCGAPMGRISGVLSLKEPVAGNCGSLNPKVRILGRTYIPGRENRAADDLSRDRQSAFFSVLPQQSFILPV